MVIGYTPALPIKSLTVAKKYGNAYLEDVG